MVRNLGQIKPNSKLGLRPISHGIRAGSVSPDLGTPEIKIAHAPDDKHWA